MNDLLFRTPKWSKWISLDHYSATASNPDWSQLIHFQARPTFPKSAETLDQYLTFDLKQALYTNSRAALPNFYSGDHHL